jgi:ribonuclease HII
MMRYLIGTDEAGYGPNLGPLVITGTVWHVPDEVATGDLYEWLDGVVSRKISRKSDASYIAIADSKALYKPGGGLAALEYGVLSTLAAARINMANWCEAWQTLAPHSWPWMAAIPWYGTFDPEVPVDADPEQVRNLSERFRRRIGEIGVRLVTVRSVAVFPEKFNELVDQLGSKGAVLSGLTIDLVKQLLAPLGDEAILVQCDKHGGRNKYGRLLQNAFPDYLVEVRGEGRARSVYRWGPPNRRVETRFVAKGESFLPAALASMVSKYLRELAMMAFNEFWKERVPGLKPTAGYPADARRFRADIAACQSQLQIADRVLWRNR